MSELENKAVREFVYFIQQTGQLSGDDVEFLKSAYYDFKEFCKIENKE
tara:strand:+ start:447 stop:590 length:144 start_codon:yes stop_codon:yes gene_type:complete